ncbi:Dam family site-specific DNA-(adenine-N6)-methyltransferase [Billgrantia tianxiuensis]|uniref:Site-specific DNA-methyltransferase (adenine-specific) n=2 Tax=Halomonadaceae TaxID=28256 RepID=A0A6I6SVX9_9GAMM|nr:Dam family site-specific DNA-(adenine-N6)-methyltransferase [Halomonas tianxiuensis]
MKPFIKWAGGKRWLISNPVFEMPAFTGRYIEPFLGGGAIFFHLRPNSAILSDINFRLIEAYQAIRDDWKKVEGELRRMQRLHSKEYYYQERSRKRRALHKRAAQFLYLNRTCWNGLYRENLRGEFNVPIGTKDKVIFEDEDFKEISSILQGAEILSCDFSETIAKAREGDLVFVDPPYTTAHNVNGFVKYNQNIFSWEDQLRLKCSIAEALENGAKVILTNADHDSVHQLYSDMSSCVSVGRASVISGKATSRRNTSEALFYFGNRGGDVGKEFYKENPRACDLAVCR